MVTVFFPIIYGTEVEEMCNRSIKAGTVWYKSICLALLIRELVSLLNHSRYLIFKAKLGTLSVQPRSRTLQWWDTNLN